MQIPSQEPQIFNEATQNPPEQGGLSFEVENNEALGNVSDVLSSIQESIVHDKSVTAKDILDLKKSLGDLTVDIEGMKIPIRDIKDMQGLVENKKIWDEINEGNYENIYKLTFLFDNAAEHLSVHKYSLYLDGLTSLSDKAAEHLSRHQDSLFFDNLVSLSDTACQFLAQFRGNLYVQAELQKQINRYKKR